MRFKAFIGASVLLAVGQPAQAQLPSAWRVNATISGRHFVLDCRFDQGGGVCVDAESGGKRSHALTSLSFADDQARWSFRTRVMLMSITLAFTGRVEGNRMSGTATAAGRSGTFTAVRS